MAVYENIKDKHLINVCLYLIKMLQYLYNKITKYPNGSWKPKGVGMTYRQECLRVDLTPFLLAWEEVRKE